MKKVILIFGLLIPVNIFAAVIGIIRTDSGKSYKGYLSNNGDLIEWRQDVIEAIDEKGNLIKYNYKPEIRGKTRLYNINEIKRLGKSDDIPVKKIITKDGLDARFVFNYLVKLKNGKYFYISDFVTLNPYYIDVSSDGITKRIYISQIRYLKILSPERKTKKKQSPKIKRSGIFKTKVIEQSREQFYSVSELGENVSREKINTNIYLFIIICLLTLFSIVLLILFLQLRKRYGVRKIRKSHSKSVPKKRKKPIVKTSKKKAAAKKTTFKKGNTSKKSNPKKTVLSKNKRSKNTSKNKRKIASRKNK